VKNKIIYGIIVIASIIILFIFVDVYNSYVSAREKALLREIISEIYYEDLDNFILENPTSYVYILVGDKQDSILNLKVRNLVMKNYLEEPIVLLFLEKEQFDLINSKYEFEIEKNAVMYFKDRVLIGGINDFDSPDAFIKMLEAYDD
jgi:hypothetical protein